MALFWDLHCTNDDCDFRAVIGWTHELPADIRLAFCSHCFQQIHMQEVHDKSDPEFMDDVRVMRVMLPNASQPSPCLGKTPRERRLRRKELGLLPMGRSDYSIRSSTEMFTPTGTYLYYLKQGGVFPGMEQALCPYCKWVDAIVIGFPEPDPACPKCRSGTIRSDAGSGW